MAKIDIGEGVPAPGTAIERDIIRAEHSDYTNQRNRLRFYREAYDGSGGYAPFLDEVHIYDDWPTDESMGTVYPQAQARTYLYRHPRERAKFYRRYMMAYSPGTVRKCLNMIVGFLTKADIQRPDYPPALEDWMESVNARSATWDILLKTEIVPAVLYYGRLPVLLHYPPSAAITAAQQRERGETLRCSIINPEVITDWRTNETGGYEWLKYTEHVDATEGPLTSSHDEYERYWYLTQAGWFFIDDVDTTKDPVVTASGLWHSDGMPLVVWELGGDGTSLCKHAAELERELFNLLSDLKEIERETCYPQRHMPDPGGEEARAKVSGSDNVIWTPTGEPTLIPPGFMAPPAEPFEHFRDRIQEVQAHILEEFGLEFSEGATTGVAQSFKMSKIVRLLVNMAADLAEGEYATHAQAAEMLGAELPRESRSIWPTEFDARDVEKEVATLVEAIDAGIGKTYTMEAKRRIARTVMPNMPQALKDDGDKDIESEADEEENADEMPMMPDEQGAFGQPGLGTVQPPQNMPTR